MANADSPVTVTVPPFILTVPSMVIEELLSSICTTSVIVDSVLIFHIPFWLIAPLTFNGDVNGLT